MLMDFLLNPASFSILGRPGRPAGQISFSRGPARRPSPGSTWRSRPHKKKIWPAGQGGMAGRPKMGKAKGFNTLEYIDLYIKPVKIHGKPIKINCFGQMLRIIFTLCLPYLWAYCAC